MSSSAALCERGNVLHSYFLPRDSYSPPLQYLRTHAFFYGCVWGVDINKAHLRMFSHHHCPLIAASLSNACICNDIFMLKKRFKLFIKFRDLLWVN